MMQLCIEPLVPQTSYQLFLGAVVLSALLGGVADGILTLMVSAVGRFFFFPAPRGLFVVQHPAILVRLVLFVVIGASVAWLVGRLRVAQGQTAAALTSTVDAVVLTNARNRIVFLNPVAEVLTGWTRQQAAGRRLEEVVQLAPDEAGDGVSLVSKGGEARSVEHSTAPIRGDGGRVRGAMVVFRDVSERRQFEAQLRQARTMEALGRLASNVAHDFNNLLTVIGGHAELIANSPEATPLLRRSGEAIRDAFDRATRLTRQLLMFSRRRPGHPHSLDLNQVLRNLEGTLRGLTGDRIELVTDFEPGLDQVKADTGQIEQVMLNLVVNARDAMPDGGTVTIRTRNAQLAAPLSGDPAKFRPGAYVALEVRDTGAGMDEKTRSRIFEPFFTTKPASRGTGLGLAIVYGIVEQCGGQIQVSSEPGHGTIFTIFLPDTGELDLESSPRPLAAPQTPGRGTHPAKGVILLAEDYDPLRNLLVLSMKAAGYEVLPARDGAQALNIAAAELNHIDLVVTDIDMPIVSGTELMQHLWMLNPKLKVLYMSGHSTLGEQLTRGRVNARFIAKPFSPAALLEAAATFMDDSSSKMPV